MPNGAQSAMPMRNGVVDPSSAWLRARVTAERQILASLDHPNIVKLLDAGTTGDGRTYLVMEHVSGLPLDVYCDRMRLSIRERVRLFVTVARGVEHAHHNQSKAATMLGMNRGTLRKKLKQYGML